MNGKSREFITHSPEETEAVAVKIGELIKKSGEKVFLALYGDLGAGKTVFVRGLSSVLSPNSRVKSPTFTLVNEYRKGDIPLFHFDLYRIEDERELDGFGFEEYIENGSCITEWSEHLTTMMPTDAVKIRIEKLDETDRRITIANFDI